MVEDDKKVIKGAVKQRQKLIGVAVISSDILQTNQRWFPIKAPCSAPNIYQVCHGWFQNITPVGTFTEQYTSNGAGCSSCTAALWRLVAQWP